MIPTPHISAKSGEIAKTVLMPGDPLRAKFIANNYLTDVICFNEVRAMFGFTGKYKGSQISVMGSGMGIPSIGIYSYELFNFYDVDNIIRVGSCGGLTADLNLMDIILVDRSYSSSSYLLHMQEKSDTSLTPSSILNSKIKETASKLNIDINNNLVFSEDVFYNVNVHKFEDIHKDTGAVAVDMESFGLFANASYLNKHASSILTVSDNLKTHESMNSTDREKSFTKMVDLALNTAIKLI